ncbi:hypothetical protein SAMN02799622_01558 [Methylobacterium sp. UNC378MF]|uniref:hypothetical protein n=1 Tax=Methylobacterium sp. UNC378MF TaxID=1502748 RepID=UPI000883819B|nr:hypothetical protein [Methylobacterium sp. UNC378MF]SDA16406.1 hypothetical protein SAMN02799622_01558 [Methylobacterium sp. UNC378MF]
MPARRLLVRTGICALLLAAGPALAADFDGPYPQPHGYGGPAQEEEPEQRPLPPPPRAEPEFRGPRFTAAPPDTFREFVRRRFDPDGAPVLRRVRVCDEPVVDRGPPPPPPPEDIPPRRWGGPRW